MMSPHRRGGNAQRENFKDLLIRIRLMVVVLTKNEIIRVIWKKLVLDSCFIRDYKRFALRI